MSEFSGVLDNSTVSKGKAREPAARRVKASQALKLCPDDMATDFDPVTCGCDCAVPDITDLCVQIGRVGEDYSFQYDAFDVTPECKVRFIWDANILQADPGYYNAKFFKDDCEVGYQQIRITKDRVIDTSRHSHVKCKPAYNPTAPDPSLMSTDFTTAAAFNCNLAAVLEKTATTLSLCDGHALTDIGVLAQPVELIIEDGMNTEIITYDGNAAGTFERGSPCYRFPKGAVVKFAWTPGNVAAAAL